MLEKRPELLIFDVNETLLDLAPLKTGVNEMLRSEFAFDLWFQTLLHYSLVETVSGQHADFSAIAAATLKMVAKKLRIQFSENRIFEVLGTIRKLPAHKDVHEGLLQLAESGFSMVALTNGNHQVLSKQLKYAEIDKFFEATFSVESVRHYKPHALPYNHVLEKMNVLAENTLMIAAHGWDLVGAKRAGLKTAFIEREGKSLYSLGENPDSIGATLSEIVKKLIAL